MWKVLVAATIAIFAMSDEQPIQGAQGAADSELTQRLAEADTVVSGVVVATTPLESQSPISEHNAQWQRATIEIGSVEKGHLTAKTIDVLFASSTDIAWHRSPKLKKGDRGVWLLHKRDPFGRATPGLAVVQPADQQPIADLEKVRGLLKNSRKP